MGRVDRLWRCKQTLDGRRLQPRVVPAVSGVQRGLRLDLGILLTRLHGLAQEVAQGQPAPLLRITLSHQMQDVGPLAPRFAQPDAPAICSSVVTETVTQSGQGGFKGGHFRRIFQPGGQIEHGFSDQSRYGGAADVFHLAAWRERKPEPRRFLPEGFCPARVVFAQPQFAASQLQPRFVLINGPDSFNGITKRVSVKVKLIKTKPKETQ